MLRKDLVFICSKCEHHLYLTNGVKLTGKEIAKKLQHDCPNCGEEHYDLWRFSRIGDYNKE